MHDDKKTISSDIDSVLRAPPPLFASCWWGQNRLLMMTSSNGNIFRVTGPLCGEFTGPGEFPAQRPVTLSFDVFFDLRLNKRLSKQPWGWWFETLSWSLWRHRNVKTHKCITWCLDHCDARTWKSIVSPRSAIRPSYSSLGERLGYITYKCSIFVGGSESESSNS